MTGFSMGQLMVVVAQDERGVLCSYAGVKDLDAAQLRLANSAPQSMTEWGFQRNHRWAKR